jgi:cyclophilin family peptidyl-prolyl cis-trans isomerase
MFRPSFLLLIALVVGGCASSPTPTTRTAEKKAGPPDGLFAEITTPRGLITCELFFEQVPLTVASFVGLAEGTLGPEPRKPYFDGLTFHRVASGFVIQGGDPTGTGSGGPGYRFPDEFAAGLRHDVPGMLSMANSGPDTNGSQFFITLGEARYLDYVHSIFGRVIGGAELPTQIQRGDTMSVKIIRRGSGAFSAG